MKRLLLTALLAGVAPAALAQAAPAEPAAAAPATQVADATQEPERYCLRETGSRIVARQNAKGQKRCNAMPGRAYTREDLDRTGQVNIADALRTLDPAVR